jgi:hypothetical protein
LVAVGSTQPSTESLEDEERVSIRVAADDKSVSCLHSIPDLFPQCHSPVMLKHSLRRVMHIVMLHMNTLLLRFRCDLMAWAWQELASALGHPSLVAGHVVEQWVGKHRHKKATQQDEINKILKQDNHTSITYLHPETEASTTCAIKILKT